MGGPIPWTGNPGWFNSGEKELSTYSLLSADGWGCDEQLQGFPTGRDCILELRAK